MKFRLPRQEIGEKLRSFYYKKIKEFKVYTQKPTKNHLMQIVGICREIEKEGLPNHLIIKKLQGKLGSGVFLRPDAKPILRGVVIAPYSGAVFLAPQNEESTSDYMFGLVSDIRLTQEEHGLFDSKNRYHPRRLYSFDLDAEKKGNFTRFINHSKKPNVEARMFRIDGSFEIIYVAKTAILPGEQLLVCYEGEDKSYWSALKIKPFPMTPKTFRLNQFLQVIQKIPLRQRTL